MGLIDGFITLHIYSEMMSDVVIAYEKENFPIGKPTIAELIEL